MPVGIQSNVLLAPYTTFGIGGPAEYFYEATTVENLREAVAWAQSAGLPVTVLGGGSNVLVADRGVYGLVVKIGIRGIEYLETGDGYEVTVGAGEALDALVVALIERGIPGFENLSGIPGTVGATPVQNVGAYGVEVKDNIISVRTFDMGTGTMKTMHRDECAFGYRSSVFKTDAGKSLVVIAVTFMFSKHATPKIGYKDIAAYFSGHPEPTLTEIRNAILEIRNGKFPDWSRIGTAGSFFKNPVVTKEKFDVLKARYPELPGYPESDGRVKIALGYVLDKILGLKGYRAGDIGLYEHQALVLIQYGKRETGESSVTAHDIKQFAKKISTQIFDATGISVEWEVRELA